MRNLFFSVLAVGFLGGPQCLATATTAKSVCSVYKVKALVLKKKEGLFLTVLPGTRSETRIKVTKDSAPEVLPFADQVGNFTVKIKAPYKKFGTNEGQVLTSDRGLNKAHLSGYGTEIICIE